MAVWNIMTIKKGRDAKVGTLQWHIDSWSYSTDSQIIRDALEEIKRRKTAPKPTSLKTASWIEDSIEEIASDNKAFVDALSDYLIDRTGSWLEEEG